MKYELVDEQPLARAKYPYQEWYELLLSNPGKPLKVTMDSQEEARSLCSSLAKGRSKGIYPQAAFQVVKQGTSIFISLEVEHGDY